MHLAQIDLIKEINKWKEIVGKIRLKFEEQERQSGGEKNMKLWLAHWDRQLYKVI